MAGQAVELEIDTHRDDHVKALIDNARTKKEIPVMATGKFYKKFSKQTPNPSVEILDYKGHIGSHPVKCRVREFQASRELASKMADITHPHSRYTHEDSGDLMFKMHEYRTTRTHAIKKETQEKKARHAKHLRTFIDVPPDDALHRSHLGHRHGGRYKQKYSRAVRRMSLIDTME